MVTAPFQLAPDGQLRHDVSCLGRPSGPPSAQHAGSSLGADNPHPGSTGGGDGQTLGVRCRGRLVPVRKRRVVCQRGLGWKPVCVGCERDDEAHRQLGLLSQHHHIPTNPGQQFVRGI